MSKTCSAQESCLPPSSPAYKWSACGKTQDFELFLHQTTSMNLIQLEEIQVSIKGSRTGEGGVVSVTDS
jgi:hypothetical protein